MNPRGHWVYSHRIPREKVDCDVQVGWSEWRRIMKPTQYPENSNPRYKSRFPEPGFRLTETESFPDYFTGCGVYELMVLKSRMELVVYIGSTCQKKKGSLRRRIQKYCNRGSHNKKLINGALEKGDEVHVRVKRTATKADAEKLENELLDKYDYAWNERENGIRKILDLEPEPVITTESQLSSEDS